MLPRKKICQHLRVPVLYFIDIPTFPLCDLSQTCLCGFVAPVRSPVCSEPHVPKLPIPLGSPPD